MKRGTLVLITVVILHIPSGFMLGSGTTGRDQRQEDYQIAWVYGYGSPVEFTVKASRGKITMAAGVNFVLEARYPVGWQVSFPDIETNIGGLLVREQREAPPRLDSSGNMVTVREYRLEPLSPGLYFIPPMELMVSEARGEYVSGLWSDVVPIMVTSLLPEGPSEPRLLDMIFFPEPVNPWTLLLIVLGALAAAGGGVFLLRGRPAHPTGEEKRPFWETAQAGLDALLAEGLIERGEYRLFYDRLLAFFKSYVNSRFMMRISEKTTEELLQIVTENQRLREHRDTLAALLKQCDLGRFSPHPPSPEEMSENVGRLRAFLRATGRADHPDFTKSDAL
jgi:hypothetical protein